MKKTICLLLALFPCVCWATIYADLQTLGGYPLVGMGFRTQKGIHGLDLSFNACPLNPPLSLSTFHLRGLYLLYPAKEGLYFGTGAGIVSEWEILQGPGPSIEGALGFSFKRIFFEIDTTLPIDALSLYRWPLWPGLTLGVGF